VDSAAPSTVRRDQKDKARRRCWSSTRPAISSRLGGPGAGFDWPEIEHASTPTPELHLDRRQRQDRQSSDQIHQGRQVRDADRKESASKGNKDTANVKDAADIFYHARPTSSSSPTAMVTGASSCSTATPARSSACGARSATSRRQRAAPAKVPEDQRIPAKELTDRGPEQFVQPVHACGCRGRARLCLGRGGKRVQVFTLEGKYMNQVSSTAIAKRRTAATARRLQHRLLARPRAEYLYVRAAARRGSGFLDRKTLTPLDSFGRNGWRRASSTSCTT